MSARPSDESSTVPNAPPIDDARRVSFDARAELYDAARPSYPDALADDVISHGGRRVLEIGPGTGKATLVFARRGASIVAIEPGASLAAVLRRNVAGLDVSVENTTFEAWPIARPFDVVMFAQAIHWIAPAVRYAKPAAVLAPGGTLAVIRNETLRFESGLRDEIDAAYARWPVGQCEPPVDNVVEASRLAHVGEIDASGLYGAVDVRVYPWTATYTTARYLDLLDTYSDHALLAPEHRASLYQAIAEAIERRGGVVEIRYVSMAFLARRA
jgi:SAM-dependent methyltransferase